MDSHYNSDDPTVAVLWLICQHMVMACPLEGSDGTNDRIY